MNKVRCPNGHEYDSDLYRSCPICAQFSQAGRREAGGVYDSHEMSFGQGNERDQTMPLRGSNSSFSWGSGGSSRPENGGGRAMQGAQGPGFSVGSGDETVGLYQAYQSPDLAMQPPRQPQSQTQPQSQRQSQRQSQIERMENPARKAGPAMPGTSPAYSTGSGDETVGLYQMPPARRESFTAPDDDRTVGLMNMGPRSQNTAGSLGMQPERNAPVAGWLVCTEGEEKGKSFIIYPGKNFVGRSEEMDIRLLDRSVSRKRHAVIIYEPRLRKFYAQPGESHELFYINDSVVLFDVELHEWDELLIGSTILRFIPFCGERFGWEEKGD